MSGYNPYRKSNGEFASKNDLGSVESKVEDDLREAQSSGDQLQVAQIESYAMDKLPESKLGKSLLERNYGSAPSSVPSKGDGKLPKPARNSGMEFYEMSEEEYDPRTAKVGESFYDENGHSYKLVWSDASGSSSGNYSRFRMKDIDGAPLRKSYKDGDDYDLVIDNQDRSEFEGMRRLTPPITHLNAVQRGDEGWRKPQSSNAMGGRTMTDERFEFDELKPRDRFYDEAGNTYTVTSVSGSFAELQMTVAEEEPFRNPRRGEELKRDMVIAQDDRRSHSNLRKLSSPGISGLARSLFGS